MCSIILINRRDKPLSDNQWKLPAPRDELCWSSAMEMQQTDAYRWTWTAYNWEVTANTIKQYVHEFIVDVLWDDHIICIQMNFFQSDKDLPLQWLISNVKKRPSNKFHRDQYTELKPHQWIGTPSISVIAVLMNVQWVYIIVIPTHVRGRKRTNRPRTTVRNDSTKIPYVHWTHDNHFKTKTSACIAIFYKPSVFWTDDTFK